VTARRLFPSMTPARWAGIAAVVVLVAAVLLFPAGTARHAAVTEAASEGTRREGEGLLLRSSAQAAATPGDAPQRDGLSTLGAVSELCTAFGRVADPAEMSTLLARAADLLDAPGLVVFQATASGELRPIFAHGYSSEILARMPTLARLPNNPVGAALRSASLQIVPSEAGSRGAISVPIMSSDGCIGVFSAELRGGAEASGAIHALAAILAAQLAGLMAPVPAAASEAPALASGA